MQDIHNRQRSVVFPETVENEARFWRNLRKAPWKTSAVIGLSLLAAWVVGWLVFITTAVGGRGIAVLFAELLIICGPIFLGLAWAVQRTLKKIGKNRNSVHARKG
jgi:hypothetical protein